MRTVSVMPANGGWRVSSDAIHDLMFRRGRTAERAALRLARAAAAAGELVRLEVRLADGSVARRFICPEAPLGDNVEWSRHAAPAG
jgi:hypothetical protein